MPELKKILEELNLRHAAIDRNIQETLAEMDEANAKLRLQLEEQDVLWEQAMSALEQL